MARRLQRSQFSRLKYSRSEDLYDLKKNSQIQFWGLEDLPEIEERDDDLIHEVKDGERLYNISYRYYGTPFLDWVIAVANRMDQPDTEMWAGRKLTIPAQEYVRGVLVR